MFILFITQLSDLHWIKMIDVVFLVFGASLLIDVHSLNAFFDVFTPIYAILIISLILYVKSYPGDEQTTK